MEYPPIAAPNPLIGAPLNGLARYWKALATTSLAAADDPVAMAMWAAAVREGLMVSRMLMPSGWVVKDRLITLPRRP